MAVWIDISSQMAARAFCRDAKDDKFIHAALAAGATRLIRGDDDLLCLDPLDALRILTPRQALDERQSGAGLPFVQRRLFKIGLTHDLTHT